MTIITTVDLKQLDINTNKASVIFSLTDVAVNFSHSDNKISHHTSNASLHYLAKY